MFVSIEKVYTKGRKRNDTKIDKIIRKNLKKFPIIQRILGVDTPSIRGIFCGKDSQINKERNNKYKEYIIMPIIKNIIVSQT